MFAPGYLFQAVLIAALMASLSPLAPVNSNAFNNSNGALMSVPTKGETYAKLMEHLRKAQEESAMLAHLFNMENNNPYSLHWLAVSENFKRTQYIVTALAKRGLQ